MSRRKHATAKEIGEEQPAAEQLVIASLGRFRELGEVYSDASDMVNAWRALQAESLPEALPCLARLGILDASLSLLKEFGRGKKAHSLGDLLIKTVLAASKANVFVFVEKCVLTGDSQSLRLFADALEAIHSDEERSPLEAALCHFKMSRMEPRKSYTSSFLRKWIADFYNATSVKKTGHEYDLKEIRAAAKRLGISLREGRGQPKKY